MSCVVKIQYVLRYLYVIGGCILVGKSTPTSILKRSTSPIFIHQLAALSIIFFSDFYELIIEKHFHELTLDQPEKVIRHKKSVTIEISNWILSILFKR